MPELLLKCMYKILLINSNFLCIVVFYDYFQISYKKNMSVYSRHDTGILHKELKIKTPVFRLYIPVFPYSSNLALLHNIIKDHTFQFMYNLPVLNVVVVQTHCT